MPQPRGQATAVPPDGGWGWLVLLAAVLVNVLVPGTIKSFGVLYIEFLRVFDTTPSEASWVPALCYFLYCFLGPLTSYLSARYSYRTVTLIGGTFASGGLMLSFFANSVTYLYFSYGIMMGIGAGLCFPVTIYIVSEYFDQRRGLATGLCISGSTIGTIILSPFLQYLIKELGYRYTVLILGGIVGITLLCALAFQPVEKHMKLIGAVNNMGNQEQQQQTGPKDEILESSCSRRGSIVSNVGSVTLDPGHDVRTSLMKRKLANKELMTDGIRDANKSKEEEKVVEVEEEEKKACTGPKVIFDWSILRNPLYLVILISNSTSAIGNTNFMILLPLYGVSEEAGCYSAEKAALLLSIVSLADLVGRVGGSGLSDVVVGGGGGDGGSLLLVPRHYFFVSGLGMSGVALALLPGARGYSELAVLCGLFGLASGLYIGTTAVVLADMLGPENLTASYGISLLVGGVLQLFGPPLCNLAYERLGTFKPIFISLGAILVCGAALWSLLPLVKRFMKQHAAAAKQQQHDIDNVRLA